MKGAMMDIDPREAEPELTELPSRDETAALKAAGDDPELARDLVQQLVAGLPQELSELRQCLAAERWGMVIRIAHRLRGASSYCGVPALESQLESLERGVQAGDRERVERELARAEREAERLALTLTG